VPITGANTKPSTVPIYGAVRAAYAEFLAKLAEYPPCPIPVEADSIDLQDRADHLNGVLGAVIAYLGAILDDTAQTARRGLDLVDAESVIADLAYDLAGTIQRAANKMAWRVA